MFMPSIFRDNFVDDLFNDMFSMPTAFKTTLQPTNLMNTDVQEFDDKYQLDLELPGYAKEDIAADLKDGYLTVKASHEENKDQKDKDGKYLRRERYQGTCQRQFYVGDGLTQEDIKAAFNDGILKISIPKKEATPEIEEKKYIAIE